MKKTKSIKIPEEGKLWIEKLSEFLYLEKFGKTVFKRDGLGPYIFVSVGIIIDLIILQIAFFYVCGWNSWLSLPLYLPILPVSLFFSIWAMKFLRDKYYATVKKLCDNKTITGEKENLNVVIKNEYKNLILIIGFILFLYRTWVEIFITLQNPNMIGTIDPLISSVFSAGWIIGILTNCIWYVFYLIVVVEFFSIFVGIHGFFASKFINAEPSFKFLDPDLSGGFESIGELFLYSVIVYYIGLALLILAAWSVNWKYDMFSISIVIALWIFGYILFFVPQIRIHKYMKKKKREFLIDCEKKILVTIDDKKVVSNKDILRNINNYVLFNHAEKMREYPFNMGTIRDLMLAAIIPISAQVLLNLVMQLYL